MANSKKKNATVPESALVEGSVEAGAFLESLVGKLTLGGLLRSIREGEEETLAVFAPKLGVSTAHLSDVENGRRAVSPERASAWALALGYSEKQFVELALQALLDDAKINWRVDLVPTTDVRRAAKTIREAHVSGKVTFSKYTVGSGRTVLGKPAKKKPAKRASA